MSAQRGHATPSEQARIEQLEREIESRWTPRKALDLAQLYIDPLHEEERAVGLLRRILAEQSGNSRAIFWLAYAHRYAMPTDEALDEAARLARQLRTAPPPWNAAGLMLEASVLEASLDVPPDVAGQIALYERSVLLAPEWAQNRLLLAYYFDLVDRRDEAVRQARWALENLDKFSRDVDLVEEYFHVNVTGLMNDRQDIVDELLRLEGASS